MKHFQPVATLAALFVISGCASVTLPAAALIDETGERFDGTTTAAMSGGTFAVTNQAGVICSGEYDPFSTARRLYLEFSCTDGRSGNANIVRNPDLQGGRGTGNFADGTAVSFVFGEGETL